MGKDWAVPFFPPSLIFRSSIDRFVFRFMLLFHSILTFMKDLYQSENQVSIQQDYWYFYIVGWGKTGPAHSFPPPKSFDLSIDQLVFWFMLLFHCILTLMNDRFQRENQVFKPNIFLYCYIVGWGKTGPAHSSPPPPPPPPPPSKMF